MQKALHNFTKICFASINFIDHKIKTGDIHGYDIIICILKLSGARTHYLPAPLRHCLPAVGIQCGSREDLLQVEESDLFFIEPLVCTDIT